MLASAAVRLVINQTGAVRLQEEDNISNRQEIDFGETVTTQTGDGHIIGTNWGH